MANWKRKRAASAAAISGSPRRAKEEGAAAAAASATGAGAGSNGGVDVVEKEKGESCNYEKIREERIKENLERIQKLGIINLSAKLDSALCGGSSGGPNIAAYRRRKAHQLPSPVHHPILLPAPPQRRSSRLQNASPVSYAELGVESKKETKSSARNGLLVWQGEREEVYGEEHAAMLGSCEASWTLFVDGYDKDGRRIYDQVKGKTCHQCRQKTLGHHTHCIKCNMVQGQFCGDCLYMRYGEHVLEVKNNVNWICPVCRGICNCSLCRTKKGWPPTGTLYKKVASLGFKSVAHYLIQTRQRQTNSGDQISSQADSSSKAAELISNAEDTVGLGALDPKIGLKSEIPGEHGNEVLPFATSAVPSQSQESPPEEGSKDCNRDWTSVDISSGSVPRPRKAEEPGEVEKRGMEDSIAGRLRKRLGRGSPIG